MPIGEGSRLGAYQVQALIGEGAMGLVYRAYHEQLDRMAAVKVMQALSPDQEASRRFRREARAIAQMRHPNILEVFDFGELEGTPYMVVEYLPGGSLAERLAHLGRLDDERALAILHGLAAALDHAHEIGVVHRDVKPANVMLNKEGAPVLADFGLAKLLQSSSVTSLTGVTGTPAYMAPEQITGDTVTPAADRYALATLAYELLTGAIPFDGLAVMELLDAQVNRPPPAPSTRRAALPPAVDAVLLKGLAKEPGGRWESCSAMIDALQRALSGEEVRAQAAVAAPTSAGRTLVLPPDRSRRGGRGRPWLIGIAVVALVTVVGALAFEALQPAGPQLSLSPSTVSPGDSITITASGLPANQIGNIRVEAASAPAYEFVADARGEVSTTARIPTNMQRGTYTVDLCWTGACHAGAQLTVR